MANIPTGPIDTASYEMLEAGGLSGSQLEQAEGELGLAVAYEGNAFMFRGRMVSTRRQSDIQSVVMDISSLDRRHIYEHEFEADPVTGLILARSLNFRPMSSVGDSKPQRACVYGEKTAMMLGRERLTEGVEGGDVERLQELGRVGTEFGISHHYAMAYGGPFIVPVPRHGRPPQA